MKRFLLPLALIVIISALAGCSAGTGSSSTPPGVGGGIASVVQLQPGQYIAQTNSQILFHATVLDGNGRGIENVPVIFTNISPVGTLEIPLSSAAINASSIQVVKTNKFGIATIAVFASTEGFVSIRAEVDEAINRSRDTRTVFFTSLSFWPPFGDSGTGPSAVPGLDLEVEGDGDPYTVLEDDTGTDDDTVKVIATLYETVNGLKTFLTNEPVTFAADVPYKVGENGSCTGGVEDCEVIFLFSDTALTNSSGEAVVFLKVSPTFERDIETLFNVTAVADNISGAADIVTIFIEQVSGAGSAPASIEVIALPTIVELGGESEIRAYPRTSEGEAVPDGTTVSFEITSGSNLGTVEPFAQTTGGIATVKFYADLEDSGTATIRATSGSVSGSVQVKVLAPEPPSPEALRILPSSVNVLAGTKIEFDISGGVSPYISTSSDLNIACNSPDVNGDDDFNCNDPEDSGIWTNDSSPTVTIDAAAPAGMVTLRAEDSAGSIASATITVTEAGGPLMVSPLTAMVMGLDDEVDNDTSDDVQVFITGGVGPYTVTSNNEDVIASPVIDDATSFVADPSSVDITTVVRLTVMDVNGQTAEIEITVTPVLLRITLDQNTTVGIQNIYPPPDRDSNPSDDRSFTVIGGTPPYVVTSDNPALTPDGVWQLADEGSRDFDPNNVGQQTNVTFTVVDNSVPQESAQVVLTIFPLSTDLVISVNRPEVIGLDNDVHACALNSTVVCDTDTDCKADACSVSGDACSSDSDCDQGSCSGSVTLCSSDSDCSPTTCEVIGTACATISDCLLGGCSFSPEECNVDEECLQGHCTFGSDSCNINGDCPAETCLDGICSLSGVSCVADIDCPGNPVNACLGGSGVTEECVGGFGEALSCVAVPETCVGAETCVPEGDTCEPVGVGGDNDDTDDITFTVTGGVPPYIVSQGTSGGEFDVPNTNVEDNGPWSRPDDTPYTIDPEDVDEIKEIRLTAQDSTGATADPDPLIIRILP